MAGSALLGSILLLIIGGIVLIVLLSAGGSEPAAHPEAFALLPVPEDSPHARAFLEYYASQISWMDASVLHCVILVSNPQTEALCSDLARDYACYTAMSLEDAQQFLAGRCSIGENSGKS